ncbi:dehydratase [Novosphingobium sp. ERN07]|uniref:MaoC/PaaZ C-terminal domain-containing protein n=1 Tax=unclassified Novosphingobium TaxID=2644732 RepID=UPI000E50993D|nr:MULTISPECIES: MaoC/PaaZ C-terminal domain-containing protein [unclassified Novosphingobium]AXU20209.1 dehydratase [Novosphingobium sp. THN1]NLR41076.1 dehydratase [Novosphingobium sp. ERW19]NLR70827.1 dehydratase [Novosphingobium sp. ERN07]
MANGTEAIAVGTRVPERVLPPISRTTLALFAGASGDHNPIHVDIDFARSAGMQDVFAHGMLSMAYLAQLLTSWLPQAQLRSWKARFVSITPVGAVVSCSGEVVELFEVDNERRARLKILATIGGDVQTLAGEAEVVLL